MGGACPKSTAPVLGRRALLGFAIATPLLTLAPASHAESYGTFRVRAPFLEARFRYWWERADCYALDLVQSYHPSVARFRHRLTAISHGLSLLEFFGAVNHAVNTAAPYLEDYRSGRGSDQWASPTEFLERGGDCEDFALAKVATLKYLGWPPALTCLLVGELTRPPNRPVGHAVLAVVLGEQEDRQLILDSNSDLVMRLDHYHDFRPIYGLDASGVLMFVPPHT